jgi:hypothetical protein
MIGLAATCGHLGRHDEAATWIGKALAAADESGYRLLADRARGLLQP